MGGEHVDSTRMTVYYKDRSHRGRKWRASNGEKRSRGERGQVAVEEDNKPVQADGGKLVRTARCIEDARCSEDGKVVARGGKLSRKATWLAKMIDV